jgi:hypothetical protein
MKTYVHLQVAKIFVGWEMYQTKIQFSLKPDKNNEYLKWRPMYI